VYWIKKAAAAEARKKAAAAKKAAKTIKAKTKPKTKTKTKTKKAAAAAEAKAAAPEFNKCANACIQKEEKYSIYSTPIEIFNTKTDCYKQCCCPTQSGSYQCSKLKNKYAKETTCKTLKCMSVCAKKGYKYKWPNGRNTYNSPEEEKENKQFLKKLTVSCSSQCNCQSTKSTKSTKDPACVLPV
jgi:hypothetical protein